MPSVYEKSPVSHSLIVSWKIVLLCVHCKMDHLVEAERELVDSLSFAVRTNKASCR
jgi:hypothetical protein